MKARSWPPLSAGCSPPCRPVLAPMMPYAGTWPKPPTSSTPERAPRRIRPMPPPDIPVTGELDLLREIRDLLRDIKGGVSVIEEKVVSIEEKD